jgi:hypothetical protein
LSDQRAAQVLGVLEFPRVDPHYDYLAFAAEPIGNEIQRGGLPAAPCAVDPHRHRVQPARGDDFGYHLGHRVESEQVEDRRVVVEQRRDKPRLWPGIRHSNSIMITSAPTRTQHRNGRSTCDLDAVLNSTRRFPPGYPHIGITARPAA